MAHQQTIHPQPDQHGQGEGDNAQHAPRKLHIFEQGNHIPHDLATGKGEPAIEEGGQQEKADGVALAAVPHQPQGGQSEQNLHQSHCPLGRWVEQVGANGLGGGE